MAFFKKWRWMFIPQSSKGKMLINESSGKKTLEEAEVEKDSKPTIKEKIITTFLYLFMAAFAVSLVTYIVMSFQNHPNIEKVGDYFKYFSTTLVGFLVGANKERG